MKGTNINDQRPTRQFRIGQKVQVSRSEGAYIGTVEEIADDKVRIDWNGGHLISGALGEWIHRDRLYAR